MEIPEDIKALNEKISQLKKEQNKEDTIDKHTNFSHIARGMRMGVELASGTIVGAGMGYVLDEIFDFKFLMLLIFTILGGFAGMLNAYRYVKEINKEDRGE